MKFDNVIIGGGLSGLTAGIKLAEHGRKCAIVSSGQSAIHFFSGSFDLLGNIAGKEIIKPLDSMHQLPKEHPYQRLGIDHIRHLAHEAKELLIRAGVNVSGQAETNHFVMTPMGNMKPTWLSLDDFTTFNTGTNLPWKNAKIINFSGFLDFHTLFIQDGLKKLGLTAEIKDISMKEFEAIRQNPSEMRSSNIAKVFDQGDALAEFTQIVNRKTLDAEVVILPAVFGLFNTKVTAEIKANIDKPVLLLPALPPSVPGIRSQILIRNRFQELGGTYFLGDKVEEGIFENNRLLNIQTYNHGNIKLEAEEFVLASGSFYSKGLVAGPDKLYEPIFGLDIDGNDNRKSWFDENIFKDQAYMKFGLKTDTQFKASLQEQVIDNLYVAGSGLGGSNPLKEGSGAGISLLTSLHVADQILKK